MKTIRIFFLVIATVVSNQVLAQTIPVIERVTVVRGSGGTGDDSGKGFAIVLDNAGNVYSTGGFNINTDFDPGAGVFNMAPTAGAQDIFVTKLDATGGFVWAKAFNGTLLKDSYGIALDPSGNIYITGFYNGTVDFDPGTPVYNLTSVGYEDIFVAKLDNNGDFVWAKSMGGNSFYGDIAHSIAVDVLGNVYTTGYYNETADFDPGPGVFNLKLAIGTCTNCSQVFISKLDTDGNFIWAKTSGAFGNSEGLGNSIDAAGNVYTTGYFWSGIFGVSSNGVQDVFIAKHDTNGNLLWARAVGDPTDISISETGYAVETDPTGNVYVTGKFQGTTDFIYGPGVFNLTSTGKFDIFVLKLDASGAFVWAKGMGGTEEDFPFDIAIDTDGSLYTTGTMEETVDFDPGLGVFNIVTAGIGDTFISKLDANGNFMWAGSMSSCCGRDIGTSIVTDAAGNVFTGGVFSGGSAGNPADFDPNACTFDVISAGGFFIQKLKPGTLPPIQTITSFSPTTGVVGSPVTITGTGFSATPANNVVKFFNNRPATVTASTTTSITAIVPAGVATGKISVTTNCNVVTSIVDFIALPSITSFTPGSGPVNTTVTITGTNFSSTPANNTVMFNGTTATVTASSTTSITTKVPAGATTGTISVTVAGNTANSASAFTVNSNPAITSFSPTGSGIGVTVTITGVNFSATPANNLVKFNGTTAVVTASSTTSITTKVPTGATTGPITVTVGGFTGTSASNYTVTGTPIITITSQPQDAYVCVGSVATFSTSASGTTNIVYQWQYAATISGTYNDVANDSHYSNTATSTLSVNTTAIFGEGYYRCKISGDAAATKFTNPKVLQIQVVTDKSDATSASHCGAGKITLTVSGVSSEGFNWYEADGTPIEDESGESITRTLSVTTSFLVAVSNGMCEGPRVKLTATINPVPATPVISSSITPVAGNVTFCSSNSLTLSTPAGFTSYAWSNGATTQQINVSVAGGYTVRVTNSSGCQSVSSAAVSVTILPAPCNNNPPVISDTSVTTEIEGKVSLSLSSFVSDSDNNLDIQSLKIKKQPLSGARAVVANSMLEVDYKGISFSGTDVLGIEACDLLGSCTQKDITIEVVGDYIVYNGISPNGDGLNDTWIIQYIDAIEETKNNKVAIFNRWGDEVFSVNDYNNDDKVFRGLNNNGSELASGVYYYKIEFGSGKSTKTGYLALKK